MISLRKKIYVCAGFNTTYMGPGRTEFNPTKPMRSFEDYLAETAKGTLSQVNAEALEEGMISNFMAGRFLKQGNLAGFLPQVVPMLLYKPCIRVEGACGSGGLAIVSAIKSILSDSAHAIYVTGFEIQNTVKAVYGADYLAGAAYYNGERKNGHAHFFPSIFSERAGAYYQKYGQEKTRQALALWYANAIENARKNPKAQEYQNQNTDLLAFGLTPPNPKQFLEYLNYADCSKISDGASSLIVADLEGLNHLGVRLNNAIEIIGFASAEGDITAKPKDLTIMDTTEAVALKVFQQTSLSITNIDVLELHDCFTISGLLALEAIGASSKGGGADFVISGATKLNGELPVNPSGGLIGFGHPTGATGVRQMVDLWEQFTDHAPNLVRKKKGFGMMFSMGGNDKTLSTFIVKPAQA